jgi:hypothetical protein
LQTCTATSLPSSGFAMMLTGCRFVQLQIPRCTYLMPVCGFAGSHGLYTESGIRALWYCPMQIVSGYNSICLYRLG